MNRRAQSGVALIEALISFLILAIGILGVLYFQAFLISSMTVNGQRAEATILADELISMAQTDPANAGCLANAGNLACGSANAAAFFQQWLARAAQRLPGAAQLAPIVTHDADRTFTVALRWRQKDGGIERNHLVRTQLMAD